MPVVKICGICNLADAEKSVELGADFLGFIFAESPRRIELSEARQIRRRLAKQVKFVGVFRKQDPLFINDTADALNLDFVQLHGDESPDYCQQMRHPIIKAIELVPSQQTKTDTDTDTGAQSFPTLDLPSNLADFAVHAFLFDRPKSLAADQSWLKNVIACSAQLERWRPFFIAGGLNAENIGSTLSLDPYGVDTASGVESSAGIKDHNKLEAFFQAMKENSKC